MSSLQQQLFGPLGKEYCLYFHILSVIGFVFLVMVILYTFIVGISKKKNLEFYVTGVIGSLGYAIFYFQNRLLHSMCVGSA
jgi:hypothetical protein